MMLKSYTVCTEPYEVVANTTRFFIRSMKQKGQYSDPLSATTDCKHVICTFIPINQQIHLF